jgi:hypothetical protein
LAESSSAESWGAPRSTMFKTKATGRLRPMYSTSAIASLSACGAPTTTTPS